MIKLLVTAVLVTLLVHASNGVTCEFTAGKFASWADVRQCLYSVPANPSVQKDTIDSLTRSAEIYAFLDIAVHSPDPNLPVDVDLLAELESIGKRPYAFDYDFHDDLRYLYDQLNDAHTQYYAPTCYTTFSAMQPFAPLSFLDDNGNQVVQVSPFTSSNLLGAYSDMGFDPTQYFGAYIDEVNGFPAVEYFAGYANNSMGMSKDIGTRYNYAMTIVKPVPDEPSSSPGYWQGRTRRNPFPRKPFMEYNMTFPNGTKVQNLAVEWLVLPSKTYTGVESFMEDWQQPKKDCGSILGDRDDVNRLMEAPMIDREEPAVRLTHMEGSVVDDQIKMQRERRYGEGVTDDDMFTLLVDSTDLKFYALNDGETLVMYLDTMAPNLVETYKALNQGFNAAAERNLTRLIIDLTDNGGGSICFGRSLLAYLQQEDPDAQNWGPQDVPLSPLAVNLIETASSTGVENTIWSPAFYDDQQNNPIDNSNTSVLLPGVPHVRAGRLRNYTKLVHINDCGNFGYRIKPAQDFAPSDMIIITHGFCGSTCALFANHLALYDNVKTIVVGGLAERDQMQYTSFPGLQVLDNPAIYRQLDQLGQDIVVGPAQPGEVQPRCLPTSAAFRYCIREIYPPTRAYSTKPMEYTFQAADVHLMANQLTAYAPQYVWYEALSHFDS